MNKADLADKIQEIMGDTKAAAERILDAVFETIITELKGGREVSIAGFGIFSIKKRAARQARNPKTGATVQVPATQVPKFRPAKALKEAVK